MDFDLSADEQALAELVRALITSRQLPDPEALEEATTKEIEVVARSWLGRLGEMGYLQVAIGKAGQKDLVALLAAQKELARLSPWLLFCTEMARLAASLVAEYGSPEQRKELLYPLLSGEWIAAVAWSEQGSGAKPEPVNTWAEPVAGGYVINGEKSLVSLAPMADVIAVFTHTEVGPAWFLVHRGAVGLEVGERIATLGYGALATSPVRFAGVQVPIDRCIGPLPASSDEEYLAAVHVVEDRLATAASLGIIWLCLDEAKRGANQPRAHGKPPAGHQVIRFALAEMFALAQTAELLAFRAAYAEAAGDRESSSLRLCAKVFVTETACRVSDQAMQILASSGYRRGHPVERALRSARLGPMLGHSSDISRMVIAENLLERLAP